MAIKNGGIFRKIEREGNGQTHMTVSISGVSVMPDGQANIINEQQDAEALIYMGFGLDNNDMGLIVGGLNNLRLLAFVTWLRKSIGDEKLDEVLALSRIMNLTRHLDEIEEEADVHDGEAQAEA